MGNNGNFSEVTRSHVTQAVPLKIKETSFLGPLTYCHEYSWDWISFVFWKVNNLMTIPLECLNAKFKLAIFFFFSFGNIFYYHFADFSIQPIWGSWGLGRGYDQLAIWECWTPHHQNSLKVTFPIKVTLPSGRPFKF